MIRPVMVVQHQAVPRSVPSALKARARFLVVGALAITLGACADAPDTAGDDASAGAPEVTRGSVTITSPVDGEVVPAGSLLVTLEVAGLTIAPAGTMEPGTGHHHLVVDADLPTVGMPIPATEGVYIHMGQGQTEYELTGLEYGEHTLIAVVGDGAHMPLMPIVADTVRFVVR